MKKKKPDAEKWRDWRNSEDWAEKIIIAVTFRTGMKRDEKQVGFSWRWQNTLREKKSIHQDFFCVTQWFRMETFCLVWKKCWDNVWCSGVRQQQWESCQPIHFEHQRGHILQMQDMVSTWDGGPKSLSRFGSILYLPWLWFFTTHVCLT